MPLPPPPLGDLENFLKTANVGTGTFEHHKGEAEGNLELLLGSKGVSRSLLVGALTPSACHVCLKSSSNYSFQIIHLSILKSYILVSSNNALLVL